MSKTRRSGRIAKQVPILLLGTDTSGRVFFEETSTLVLSRHGAGILSRNKLAPDERLTLRQVGFNPEAEARLVGQIGQQGDAYVYGIEFTDPDLNFWQMEFPASSLPGDSSAGFALECSLCGSRQVVEQSDIESDVYAVNDSILRYCESCGISTNWGKAKAIRTAPPLAAPARAIDPAQPLSSVLVRPAEPTAPAATVLHEVATAVLEDPPRSQPAMAPKPASGGRRNNRRRHVRASVNFLAYIRHAGSEDDVVECDNVSRGGVSFRSRRKFEQGALLEIAVPYSPGSEQIFVYATVRHVARLPGDRFRYGIEYVKTA